MSSCRELGVLYLISRIDKSLISRKKERGEVSKNIRYWKEDVNTPITSPAVYLCKDERVREYRIRISRYARWIKISKVSIVCAGRARGEEITKELIARAHGYTRAAATAPRCDARGSDEVETGARKQKRVERGKEKREGAREKERRKRVTSRRESIAHYHNLYMSTTWNGGAMVAPWSTLA